MDQNNKIETPEEPRQEPSESEREREEREEREKVIFVLHNFYQERQGNTVVYKEIDGLIKRAEPYLEKALPYFKNEICKGYEDVKWNMGIFKDYEGEIIKITYKHPTEKSMFGIPQRYGWAGEDICETLENISKGKKQYKNDINLQEIINNLKKIFNSLSDQHQKLWSQRESNAKALLSIIGEGWEKSELEHYNKGNYDLEGNIIAKKSIISKEGKESKESLYLNLDDWSCENELKKIMKTWNVSEKEIEEIKSLDWSLEEKQKLANLAKGVEIFKQGMEKAIPQKSADLSFTKKELESLKDSYVRGFARNLYEKLNLPPLHKERVIEEIMMDK